MKECVNDVLQLSYNQSQLQEQAHSALCATGVPQGDAGLLAKANGHL